MDIRPMVFETVVRKCDTGPNVPINRDPKSEAEVSCVVLAMCVPLTPSTVERLKSTNRRSLDDFKKVSQLEINQLLEGTPIKPQISQLTCKGKGEYRADNMGKLELVAATCPGPSDCANIEDIRYNVGTSLGITALPSNPAKADQAVVAPSRGEQ